MKYTQSANLLLYLLLVSSVYPISPKNAFSFESFLPLMKVLVLHTYYNEKQGCFDGPCMYVETTGVQGVLMPAYGLLIRRLKSNPCVVHP